MNGYLTDIPGILVGHSSNTKALTGCTVILCEKGATGGVVILGGAAGTRQMDSLSPLHSGGVVHAVLITGGSAFGLEAASGVMNYLEEKEKGIDLFIVKVPIVPTATIFDLAFGDFRVRPDKTMGREACESATHNIFDEGSVGAGTGATVGKLLGVMNATKGGIGTASRALPEGVIVGGVTVVNAFGDVIDPDEGRIIAGAREEMDSKRFVNTHKRLKEGFVRKDLLFAQNTTIGIVVTNARLTKVEAVRLAHMSSSGLSRVISPFQTTVDGDLIIALSCGDKDADLKNLAAVAYDVLIESCLRAIKRADGFGIIPAYKDLI